MKITVKSSALVFLPFILAVACNKQSAQNASLQGEWVEKTNRLDTLIVYRWNGKDIMFDNSLAYRSYPTWASNYAFRFEYRLDGDTIGFRSPDSSAEFMWYNFRWNNKNEFTMQYNGLRAYLSSIGDITYTKVK